jgi:alpha-D-ribose 1-methylphosphonate 5-triphosphate synthase subunit PhnH
MRALGIDPVHDTRETFRALVGALSRPGTVHETPTAPADHAVLATLVDHEVTLSTADEAVAAALDRRGRLERAPPDEAAILHARGVPEWDVRTARRGSRIEPSGGATVVYRVDGLGPDAGAPTRVRLSGPGVPGERALSVAVPAAELRRLGEAQADYPRGVDAVFAADDRIAGLPRSVSMEVA